MERDKNKGIVVIPGSIFTKHSEEQSARTPVSSEEADIGTIPFEKGKELQERLDVLKALIPNALRGRLENQHAQLASEDVTFDDALLNFLTDHPELSVGTLIDAMPPGQTGWARSGNPVKISGHTILEQLKSFIAVQNLSRSDGGRGGR